jgi:hypothetical protein
MLIVRNLVSIIKAVTINRDRFTCRIELRGGLKFQIWEKPALWCSKEQLEKIISDVTEVVANSEDAIDIPEYGVLKGEESDLSKRIISIIYDKDDKPIAMSAQIYFNIELGATNEEVLHLGLAFVSKSSRGKSITTLIYGLPNLFILLKNGFRKQWISNVTQVPAAFGLVQDFYSDCYPSMYQDNPNQEQKIIAQRIFDDNKQAFGVGEEAVFLADDFIIEDSYTGGSDNLKKTYEQCAKYRADRRVDVFLKDSLDYERGDDFLQVAFLDIKSIVRVLKNKVIQGVLGNFIINIFLALFLVIVLPYFRWLIPNAKESNDV